MNGNRKTKIVFFFESLDLSYCENLTDIGRDGNAG